MLYVPTPEELRTLHEVGIARELQETLLREIDCLGFSIPCSEFGYSVWAPRFQESWTSKRWYVEFIDQTLSIIPHE